MNRLIYTLILFCMLKTGTFLAQSLQNYSNIRSTGVAYGSINSSGSAFDSWRNTTSFTQDDNRSDFTDIGFDFWYNGVRYTQFSVSTNGFLDFSSSNDDGGPVADAFGYSNASFTTNNTANSTNPAIAPFYDDLMAQGGTSALGNSIKYQVTGAAPNRTLTIEWINMAVYTNTTPSLNFQIKLMESTGVIMIHYGTMNTGTYTFSYTMGLNGQVLNATPTLAQLKILQTVNSNTFSNAIQNNLSAMPAANSRYVFTPPTPTTPSGTLTCTGVTQTGMTLNWTNWATNEVGYVIYKSTDGINYDFVAQTAANATNYAVTGLLPNTLYYWKLYAVTEGCLSTPITRSQTTLSGGNKRSNQSGNWSNAAIWTPAGVPTSSEDVTIANGHTVSINTTAVCNSLQVGQGAATTLQFNSGTARSLLVNKDITVSSLAVLNVNTGSNVTHSLTLSGNIVNNGTVNLATDANSLCNAYFTKNGSQTISGTGTVNTFNSIQMDMGTSINNTLEVTTPGFVAGAGFLTLNTGTFKLSTTGAVNITPFNAAAVIPQKGGLWVNSNQAVVNTSASVTMYGNITASSGTLNIGNAADEDLISNGGFLTVSGGAVNIAGKYYAVGINNLSKFSLNGGTVIVPSVGSTNTTIAPFQIAGAGSQFSMTGGNLIIPREGGTGAQDLGYVNTGSIGGSVTGGTLQIGNTTSPANQIININTNYNIGNLLVSSANVTARLNTSPLNVIGGVTINTGTLNVNNLDVTLGGNYSNNGGALVPGTGTFLFNSASAQTIFKSGGETFNNLSFSGAGTKTLLSAVTASNVTINSGSSFDVNTANYQVTVKGNLLNSGTFNTRSGLVFLNGTTSQSIGGTSTTDFYNLTLNNNAGAVLNNAENLINTLTLNNGTFNLNSKVFTMVSTATNTARIAQITGTGDITGNVTAQRFAPGGTTGWALIGTPISSGLTFQDWNDDFPITCASCPNGSMGGFTSIYSYNEAATGSYSSAASYVPITTITNPIVPNKGYWVYLGNGQTSTTPIVIDVTGPVRKFNNTIAITRTNTGSAFNDGWNLITNPYPSPISWAALKGSTTGIDNAIYAYNADLNGGAGGHATYVNGISSPAVGAGGIGDVIPMCQGFYVHSTGATALNGTEAVKVAGNPVFLKTTSTPQLASQVPLLRLNLLGSASHKDETVLYLQAGATDGFDNDYDAIKMAGQDPNAPVIFMDNGTTEFQINAIAPITSNFTIPVKTLTGYSGTYTISLTNSSFPTGACINLYDRVTHVTTDLNTSNYVFNLPSSTTQTRFDLTITLNPLQVNATVAQPTCQDNIGEIIAVGANAGPWNYYWKDASNAAVKTSLNKTGADTLKNISGGNYSLTMNTVGMCDNNESQFQINTINTPQAQFSAPDTVYYASGAYVQFTNSSSGADSYHWEFGDNIGFSTVFEPDYNYFSTGVYTVTMIASSSSGCTDTITRQIVVAGGVVTALNEQGQDAQWLVRTQDNNHYVLNSKMVSNTEAHIVLYDALGKMVKDYGVFKTADINLAMDLSGYKPGIYFLNISEGEMRKTIKLPVK